MALVNIKIEGRDYQVDSSLTVLEACRKCGYEIPSLCAFNHGKCSRASCRVCLVEIKGARGLCASCVYPVNEGMEISISSQKAVEARRASVELILSNHEKNCLQCPKNGHCELLHVAEMVGAREGKYIGAMTPKTYDEVAPGIIRNTAKCILCGRCIERCKEAQGIAILGFENRGFNTIVAPVQNRSFANVPCMQCGQCVNVCPVGALMEHSEIEKVDEAFRQGKKVIVQTAPAVRAAIAEEYGATVTGVDALADTLQLVLQRRVDATINSQVTINDYMIAHPEAEIKVVDEGPGEPVAIPVRKADDTATLIAAINEALDAMRADGTLAAISIKYFNGLDLTGMPQE